MSRQNMTVRVARWSAEHPWRSIGAWTLFVVICFVAGGAVGTEKADFDANPKGELAVFQDILDDGNFDDPAAENVLITAKEGSPEQGTAAKAAADIRERMLDLPDVENVTDPIPSPDGQALLVSIEMAGDPDTATDRVQSLLDTTKAVQTDYPDLRIEQVGGASINEAISQTYGDDFKRAEMFSIPVTLVIMLIVFGALIAAGVPVLLALSAVAAALGLSALASHLLPATDETASMILLIGMAVGVDYSLFYIRREREERAKGATHLDAVEIAAATSGHAIIVSGLAVSVAMAGMFVANEVVFTSMALGAILVVLVAMIGSVTVLPALLAKLGRWVDRPRVPLVWRLSARGNGEPRFWRTILRPSLRHPGIALTLSASALVVLAVPAFGMNLNAPSESSLPRSIPIMQSYDRMTEAFPSTGAVHSIAFRVPDGEAGEAHTAVAALTNQIAADDLFAHDRAPEVLVSKDGLVTLINAPIPDAADSARADESLDKLRDELVPETLGQVPGAEYAVSGQTAAENDFISTMKSSLPMVIALVLMLTFIVMMATFRSPVIALSAIGLNMLSAGAAYGFLVLIFQNTWAESLLGFESTGGIVAWLPVLLFVTLFGLSMDYHVFVVSRIREAAGRGMPTREAVAHGITTSAGVVTSAAAVMVAVFSIFATLTIVEMKQVGIGLAVAILLDATLIRAVVLPSLMTVLGDSNWWTPRWLRRRDQQPFTPDEPERELVTVP